jgi:hypothetical protein
MYQDPLPRPRTMIQGLSNEHATGDGRVRLLFVWTVMMSSDGQSIGFLRRRKRWALSSCRPSLRTESPFRRFGRSPACLINYRIEHRGQLTHSGCSVNFKLSLAINYNQHSGSKYADLCSNSTFPNDDDDDDAVAIEYKCSIITAGYPRVLWETALGEQ